MKLRPYQDDLINKVRNEFKAARKSVLLQLPTGGGKTILLSKMMALAAERGLRSVFSVHREELLSQTVDTLRLAGIDPGIIAAGHQEHPHKLIQVASIQTLARPKRLFTTPEPNLYVVDECHHAVSKQYITVRDAWSTSKMVGLTATPLRQDGQGLGDWFESMVEGPDISWLIKNKYLARYRAFAPTRPPDVEELPLDKGDYARGATEAMMNKPSITGDAISTWFKNTPGQQGIAFCVSVKHSMEVAQAFRDAGVNAAHLDGDTPRDIRREIVKAFRRGEITILTNVDLFGEGFDCPGASVGIFLRPTMSFGLWRQQVGRILRYESGKVAYLHDHAGNFGRHGLPDDPVTWSLQGHEKRSRKDIESIQAVRTCGKCYSVSPATAKVCEQCGAAFPLTPREVLRLQGELAEIQRVRLAAQKKIEKRGAKTLDQLIAFANKHGYKNPMGWARMQLEMRDRYKRRGG